MFDIESIYKDPASRFIILKGSIHGKKITVANVYAPNDSQATFFRAFFQTLDKYSSPHLVLGGDFNLVAHSDLDRSRSGGVINAFPKTLKSLLHSHNLGDACRAHNVGAREYTVHFTPTPTIANPDWINFFALLYS